MGFLIRLRNIRNYDINGLVFGLVLLGWGLIWGWLGVGLGLVFVGSMWVSLCVKAMPPNIV